MPNRKRSYCLRSPSHHHDRSPSESLPKRRKTPSPPPSPGGKSLDSIVQTLQQMQTEMTKTSKRISTMESLFEQHSRTFVPLHPTPDDQISVVAYSVGELLDYSEDDICLATGPQDQAIKPNYQAIKASHTGSRLSHETNVSQTPEETQPNGQASNNSASTSLLYDPDSTKSSWEPQKELSTFLEKQFRRKLTYGPLCSKSNQPYPNQEICAGP